MPASGAPALAGGASAAAGAALSVATPAFSGSTGSSGSTASMAADQKGVLARLLGQTVGLLPAACYSSSGPMSAPEPLPIPGRSREEELADAGFRQRVQRGARILEIEHGRIRELPVSSPIERQ